MKNAIMNNNMLKRTLFLTLSLIVGCCSAVAQQLKFNGFSGEAKSFYHDFSTSGTFHKVFEVEGDDNINYTMSPNSMVQYYWEMHKVILPDDVPQEVFGEVNVTFHNPDMPSPIIEIDLPHSAYPVRKVQIMILIKVTRVSKYGTQSEILVVRVTDKIIVEAKPIAECFGNGDQIKKSDFEFKVDPPECESDIDIDPNSSEAESWHQGECDQKVYFTYRGMPIMDQYTVITVIGTAQEVALVDVELELQKVVTFIESIEKFFKKCKEFTDKMEKSKLLAGTGFEFKCYPYASDKLKLKVDCCGGNIVHYIGGDIHCGVSVLAGVKIPTEMPWLFVTLKANGALDVTILDAYISVNSKAKACGSVEFFPVTLSIGVSAGVECDWKIVKVDPYVSGGINVKFWYYTISTQYRGIKPVEKSFYLKLGLEIDYTLGKARWEWDVLAE